MAHEELPAYLARCPHCGHVVGLTTDRPEHRRAVAQTVARWLRAGRVVERTTVREARRLFDPCPCAAAADAHHVQEGLYAAQ